MAQYSCFVQSFLRISYRFWRFWTLKFYCNVQFAKKLCQKQHTFLGVTRLRGMFLGYGLAVPGHMGD